MVSHDVAVDVIRGFPEVEEGTSYGNLAWKVRGKMFAWDRPFSKADIKRFGDEPVPDGPILGVKVDDLAEKEAVLASGTPGIFTIPHFDGFAALLVQLDEIGEDRDDRRHGDDLPPRLQNSQVIMYFHQGVSLVAVTLRAHPAGAVWGSSWRSSTLSSTAATRPSVRVCHA